EGRDRELEVRGVLGHSGAVAPPDRRSGTTMKLRTTLVMMALAACEADSQGAADSSGDGDLGVEVGPGDVEDSGGDSGDDTGEVGPDDTVDTVEPVDPNRVEVGPRACCIATDGER